MRASVTAVVAAAFVLSSCARPLTTSDERAERRPASVSIPTAAHRKDHLARYWAITAARSGADDVLLAADVPCGHRPTRDCATIWRSGDAGRSWTRVARPPGRLAESTMTNVGPDAYWLVEHPYGHRSRTWVTSDGGHHWHRLAFPRVRAVVVSDGLVYAVGRNGIWSGPAPDGPLRWIGPKVGNSLVAVAGTIYNYPQRWLRGRLRLVALSNGVFRAVSVPCGRPVNNSLSLVGTPAGGLLALCGSEPAGIDQPKQAFVSYDLGRTWTRRGAPDINGYFGTNEITLTPATSANGIYFSWWRAPLVTASDDGRHWQFRHVGGRAAAEGEWEVAFSAGFYGSAVEGAWQGPLFLSDDGGLSWHKSAEPP